MHKRKIATWVVGLAGLMVIATSVAIGMPWDIDMSDSVAVKAYEQKMNPLPEGVVSQKNILTPSSFTPNADRYTPEGMALTSPFKEDEAFKQMGAEMFDIYCDHCHGDGEEVGPVAKKGMPASHIFGKHDAAYAKFRSDGYIYLTIRNGGTFMPRYGYAMSDQEMWSIVRYIRRQEGGTFNAPTEQ